MKSDVRTVSFRQLLAERDYVTFGSLLWKSRLSVCLSVRYVRAPYTQGVETFGNISPPFCTLATLRPPRKTVRRSSLGNPSVGGVKHKRGSKLERRHVPGISSPDELLVWSLIQHRSPRAVPFSCRVWISTLDRLTMLNQRPTHCSRLVLTDSTHAMSGLSHHQRMRCGNTFDRVCLSIKLKLLKALT